MLFTYLIFSIIIFFPIIILQKILGFSVNELLIAVFITGVAVVVSIEHGLKKWLKIILRSFFIKNDYSKRKSKKHEKVPKI